MGLKELTVTLTDPLVLDRPALCPAPLRRLHDSGAGYKYSDLLTYIYIRNTCTSYSALINACLVQWQIAAYDARGRGFGAR